MIIKQLILENFGAFKGRQAFDFSPILNQHESKPIILIGGKNGAGKTTLFDAIRICLYGQSIDGYRFSQKEYENYISGFFHAMIDAPLNTDHCSIELSFAYTQFGKTDDYYIKRSWSKTSSNIHESLEVLKNNEKIGDIELFHWQTFISELIPPGISQLFFFDGEKIQNLAEDDTTVAHIQDSFKGLLGLHIVERLRADLSIFMQKRSSDKEKEGMKVDLETLENQKKEMEEQYEALIQLKAQNNTQRSQVLSEIERQELLIAQEGGGFAQKRDELKIKKVKIEHEIETVRAKIREVSSQIFPFALTPKYCRILKDQLLKEDTYNRWKQSKEYLDTEFSVIKDEILSEASSFKEICSDKHNQKISLELINLIQNRITKNDQFGSFQPIHQFSPAEANKILNWIDISDTIIPAKIREYCSTLDSLIQERDHLNLSLQRAPDDDILSPLITQLNDLHSERGSIEQKQGATEEKIRVLENTLRELERQIRHAREDLSKLADHSKQLNLANKVQLALDEYMAELQDNKAKELKSTFLTCFNYLLRKEGYISDVDIDLERFSITLYDRNGSQIPKKKLSLGEKQIFAISMLWALTITSDRQLPFIIDTPLGRLDSDHRTNLVQEFFPKASKQMIIFSTDTEIDLPYFGDLTSSIARSYHLEFDSDQGATTVTPGYFWSQPSEVEV